MKVFNCEICGKPTKLVYELKSGKALAMQCKGKHRIMDKQTKEPKTMWKNPVFLVPRSELEG
jgi:hypothetical protein